jgi:hypothetical protein
MAIFNPDGTQYQVTGDMRQFDPNSPDHCLFAMWDEELIKISGTPLFYYEVFIQDQTIDPIYWEDRGKIWSSQPITLYGYYEPIPSQNAMTQFGIDAPDEMKFELNYKATLRDVGHPPKIGSRIFSPHLSENWKIIQRNLGEFKKWGVIRLELICQRFQESLTTGEGNITQDEPDFNISEVVRKDCPGTS